MALPFFRLRLTLLRNALRVHNRRDVFRIVGYAALIALAATSAWLSLWLRAVAEVPYWAFDSSAGFVILVSALLIPFFAASGMIDAKQVRQFPYSRAGLSVWLVLSSVVTWMALLLIAWLVSFVVLRAYDPITVLVSALGALLFLATVQVAANISTEVSRLVFTSPRRQLIKSILGWLVLLSLAPLLVFFVTIGGLDGVRTALVELGAATQWTPFGASLSAIDAFTAENFVAALGKLAVAAGSLAALGYVWFLLVSRATTHTTHPGHEVLENSGMGWFERFPPTMAGVISARSVVSWIRDTRYRLSIAIVPAVIVIAMFSLWVAGAPATIIWVMPLAVVSFFLGWSIHNDVATDSTAIWMHVAASVPGRADRIGRLAPIMLFGIPLIIVGSTLSVAIMGDFRPLPAVVGISLSLLLTGAGVSSFASARWPYPATRPGDSLFTQPQFEGYGAAKWQVLSVLTILLLSAPALITGFIGIGIENLPLQLASLVLGAVGGSIVLAFGIRWGAETIEEEGPELIALSQVFD